MSAFAAPIAEQIWNDKYRFTTDTCIEDTWRRVAKALASVEKNPAEWEDKFYSVLEGFKFLPGGRIISGAGTGRDVTLVNCFVNGTIPDSLPGIFDKLKDAALTMQQGGGIGYDFSTIRPKGAPVLGVGSDASGPLSFMDVWNSMCKTILSAGSRRGAMMATMRCDHPDIEDFITAKRDASRLRHFNLSVLVTDDFMEAVRNDEDWYLGFNNTIYRTVRARDLWNTILESTYAYAEPGVIFIDRINEQNNLWWCETISATNPCVTGETPILTKEGWIPIADRENIETEIWNGYDWSLVTPRQTGEHQPLLRITFSDGSQVDCTHYHKFILAGGDRVEARHLSVGAIIPKHDWPVIHSGVDNVEAYRQGFFSGDGCRTGNKEFLELYGNKKEIVDELSVGSISVNEYRITGGFPGTDTTATKLHIYYGRKHRFEDKSFVPGAEWSVQSRLDWLAGLADADGTAYRSYNSVSLQITNKKRDFLFNVKLMLNTLGVHAHLGKMKDCWRLTVSPWYAAVLQELGFYPRRLDFTDNEPQRNASRFIYVTDVESLTQVAEKVYCFTDLKNHSGCFGGVMTANCGEQPLPPYGACVLGSINLTRFVSSPFSKDAEVQWEDLQECVALATRMLDNVNDATNFPLEKQREEAQKKRRIGLGITGLADMLTMIGLRYGSGEAESLIEDVAAFIRNVAYYTSVDVALDKEPFPEFDGIQYSEGAFISRLPLQLRTAIERDGIRNSHLTSIAPTGTISLLAGNVSSGIEPIFATSYTRKVLQADGTHREEEVVDYAVKLYRDMFGADAELPDYFVTTADLKPEDHVRMQAAAQKYVDSAISKTINCPEDISFDDFKDVYRLAYELGCKGCTTYRPNDVTGSVLSVKDDKKPAAPVEPVASDVLRDRPGTLPGKTYKLRFPSTDAAFYVTINDDDEGNPFEMFVNTKDPSHQAWVVALTRMVSAVFRRGGDVRFVAEELQAVFDPNGGAWIGGKYVPSIPAAIGAVLSEHLGRSAPVLQEVPAKVVKQDAPIQVCPKCFGTEFKKEAGCETCLSCGHSKCG